MSNAMDISLAEVIDAGLRLARANLAELERRGANRGEMTDEQLAAHAKQVNSNNRALSTLAKEARSLQRDSMKWAERLSIEEKRAAIVDFLETLPGEQQRRLLQDLARVCNETRRRAD
jgi:hypothetical protein